MRPKRWSQYFYVPLASEGPSWPSSAVCVRNLTFPDLAHTTGGSIWVQIRDSANIHYDGVAWLHHYEIVRTLATGAPFWNYTQVARIHLSPARRFEGDRPSLTVIDINLPWGATYFGANGYASIEEYGPLPILTSSIITSPTPSWTLESYTDVIAQAPLLQQVEPGRKPGASGLVLSGRTGRGDHLLRAGNGAPAYVSGPVASGAGYRLSKAGSRQIVRFTGGGARRGAGYSSVRVARYISQTGLRQDGYSFDNEGWNITVADITGMTGYYTRTLVKVAVIQTLTGPDGRTRVVAGGLFGVSFTVCRVTYGTVAPVSPSTEWTLEITDRDFTDYHLPASGGDAVSTFGISPAGVPVVAQGCVVAGQFNVDGSPYVSAVNDFDTWPYLDAGVSVTWGADFGSETHGAQVLYPGYLEDTDTNPLRVEPA